MPRKHCIFLTSKLTAAHAFINPRCACAARITVVGSVYVSVCLSVKPHLMYSTANEGEVGFSVKLLCYEYPALPPSYGHTYRWPFFLRKAHMRISCIYHVVWTEAAISLYLLAQRRQWVVRFLLIMPPSKVCPQCDAVVLIRLKVCNTCQHVFCAKRQIQHTLPGRAMKWLRVALSDSVKSVIKTLQKECKRAAESSMQTLLRMTGNTEQALERPSLAAAKTAEWQNIQSESQSGRV